MHAVKSFLPQFEENLLGTKRPTMNIRVFDDTVELMRDEQVRIRKQTRIEPTYAELIERAWELYQMRDSTAHSSASPEEIPSAYSPKFKHWHDMLEEILTSEISEIDEAIRQNLKGFKKAIDAIKALWNSGELPDEKEREALEWIIKIMRGGKRFETTRKLLINLAESAKEELKEPNPPSKESDSPQSSRKRKKAQ